MNDTMNKFISGLQYSGETSGLDVSKEHRETAARMLALSLTDLIDPPSPLHYHDAQCWIFDEEPDVNRPFSIGWCCARLGLRASSVTEVLSQTSKKAGLAGCIKIRGFRNESEQEALPEDERKKMANLQAENERKVLKALYCMCKPEKENDQATQNPGD